MPPSNAQRTAVLADLDCLIMSSGTDAEIAEDHGVTPDFVRALRRVRRQELWSNAVRGRLRELGTLVGWPGSDEELLIAVLDARLCTARERDGRHPADSMQALRVALRDRRYEAALERAAATAHDEGTGRDKPRRTDLLGMRSRAPAEAREGVSGG